MNNIYCKHVRKILAKGPKYRDPQSINWKHNFNILINSVEGYVRKWTNRENEEVDTILKWVKALILLIRIRKFQRSMSANTASVFKDPEFAENLSINSPHICFCFAVPAYKDHNNIGLIWKQILHWFLKEILRLGSVTR